MGCRRGLRWVRRCLRGAVPVLPLLLLLVAALVPPAASAAPRPLSDAERSAVQWAAEYLERGPAAFWDHLSADSPLRGLGKEAALAEIEARAGLPGQARWQLETVPLARAARAAVFRLEFPSGLDDFLELAVVPQAQGGFALRSLRVAAEPAEGAAAPQPAAAAESGAPSAWRLPAAAGAGALVVLLAALGLRRRRALAGSLGGLAAALLAVAVIHGGPLLELARRTAPGAPAASAEKEGGPALRPLLALRRALTQPGGALPAEGAAETGPALEVARLWRAQHLIGSGDLPTAEKLLASLPSPSERPAAEILRARLNLLRFTELETATGYQRALAAAGTWEGLLLEAAEAFNLLGFEQHGRDYLAQLTDSGARSAAPYYDRAEYAALDHHLGEARQLFEIAWRLEPLPRGELLGRPVLAYLLSDPAVRRLVPLDDPEEAAPRCREAGARALPFSPAVRARTMGEELLLEVGTAELRVPAGCSLAPATAPAIDPAALAREREERALARLPVLLATANLNGALAQPVLRQQTLETARALALRSRWDEVAALTVGLGWEGSVLPAELTRLRAAALVRLEQREPAQKLLIRLSKRNKDQGRPDPQALYQLADLVAGSGDYDTAIKLVTKANAELPFEPEVERLRQLQMEKRLAQDAAVKQSAHFAISYPARREPQFAERAARILEAERARLQRFIPLSGTVPRIEVDLLPFEDFEVGWSQGGEVIGLFDGKIRLPLGNVRRWHPIVVSVMTHELAHAMIAEKTAGRAPHWFQEGLAQHVEMVDEQVNSIEGYQLKGYLLAFPLLEPVLRGFGSPAFTSVAYDESAWALHYIETRYGVAGIHRLMAAFAAGQTTEQALPSALGVTPAELDRALWAWCLQKAPSVWRVPIVRYDVEK